LNNPVTLNPVTLNPVTLNPVTLSPVMLSRAVGQKMALPDSVPVGQADRAVSDLEVPVGLVDPADLAPAARVAPEVAVDFPAHRSPSW
jgi:hypothetical protein